MKEPSCQFEALSSPRVVERTGRSNVAVYEYKHEERSRTPRVLTAHILPGVNIRPQLVIETIPGLYIPGGNHRQTPKVRVDYVNKVADSSEPRRSWTPNPPVLNLSEEDDPISITESTTSRFELVEEMVEKESLESEIKLRLKRKIKDILIKKYNIELEPPTSSKDTTNITPVAQEGPPKVVLTQPETQEDSPKEIITQSVTNDFSPKKMTIQLGKQEEKSKELNTQEDWNIPEKLSKPEPTPLQLQNFPSSDGINNPSNRTGSETVPETEPIHCLGTVDSPRDGSYSSSFEEETNPSTGHGAAAQGQGETNPSTVHGAAAQGQGETLRKGNLTYPLFILNIFHTVFIFYFIFIARYIP